MSLSCSRPLPFPLVHPPPGITPQYFVRRIGSFKIALQLQQPARPLERLYPCWCRCRVTARKYSLHPPQPLAQVSTVVPESPERSPESQRQLDLTPFEDPRECCPHVVVS